MVIDSTTGKLRGNYEAAAKSPITVTSNVIGLNIDANKMKITDDGKLTTLSKAIEAGDGLARSNKNVDNDDGTTKSV